MIGTQDWRRENQAMALSEFAAIETAYRALTPLDPAARQRGLAWLSSALGGSETCTTTLASPVAQRP
jgi:hypothetical protein